MSNLRHRLWLRFGGQKRLDRDLREVAADDHDVQVALTLIKMGASPNGQDPETGRTPLMVAVDYDCRSIITALLSHQADPHIKANNGKSALDLAQEAGKTEIADLLEQAHKSNQNYRP